jgi:hypothetical protein
MNKFITGYPKIISSKEYLFRFRRFLVLFCTVLLFSSSIVTSQISPVKKEVTIGEKNKTDKGIDNINSIPGIQRVVIAEERANPMFIPPPPQFFSKARNRTNAATFNVTYTGFTAQQQAAFQYAVDIWASLVTSTVTINISVTFAPLGPGILGQCGPGTSYRWGGAPPYSNTWYPVALAEKIYGSNMNGASTDITGTFSTNFAANLYLGTDGACPAGKYDFVTLVLHELCHGLGYVGSMSVAAGSGSWGGGSGYPYVFDRFLYDGSSVSLLNTGTYPNPSITLGSELTSNSVYWSGPSAGTVQQYAPGAWSGGSSIYHVAEVYNGTANALMTYSMGTQEVIHNPGPIVLNELADMGWGVTAPPATYTISGQITVGGSPLSGVTVTLSGSSSGTTTTDGSGNYSFTGLVATGDYTVTPSKTNYTFTPTSRTFANLGSDQTGNFTATGAPAIGLNPSSLSYGSIIVGNSSNLTVTISNTGTAILAISGLSFTGTDASMFSLPGGESTLNINPSGSYVLTVRFTPTSSGAKSASLRITHNATGSPSSVSLSGTGQQSSATISSSRSSINFGSINYATTSVDSPIVISNTSSTTSLNISSISFGTTLLKTSSRTTQNLSPDYILAADSIFKCLQSTPIVIAAGSNTTLTIRFSSDSVGNFTKVLHILNSSSNNPDLTVTLTGSVTGSTISPAFTNVNFGSVGQQTGNKDTTIRITNSGATKLKLFSASLGTSETAFEILTPITSPVLINAGSYYDLRVRFKSDQVGTKNNSVNIQNNSSNTPNLVINLTGVVVQPGLTITPSDGNYGTTSTTTPSISKTFQLKNTGTTSISISSKTLSGDTSSFYFTKNLSNVTLSSGQTDEVIIDFFPRSSGSKTATFNIVSNDIAPNRSLSLSGVGGGNPVLTSSLNNINLGDMVVGNVTDTSFTISNTGNLDLIISSKTFTGNDKNALSFVSGGNPVNLRYQQSETIKIRFTASLPAGNKTAQLQIANNDPNNSSYSMSISANAKSAVITKSTDKIVFDSVMVGSSVEATFNIKNSGNVTLVLGQMLIDGTYASDFSLEGVSTPVNINQNEERTFTIKFDPLGLSSRFARLVINSNDPSKPEESIILRGFGKQSNAPVISVDANNIDFGNIEVNKYKEVSYTITNTGASTLHIDSLNIVGTDNTLFSISNSVIAPLDISPGGSKLVTIKFSPTSSGLKSANIRIKHNASGSPTIVTFSGTGITAGITINPLSVLFGDVKSNSSKDTNILILNNGSATLTISNVQFAGTDGGLFTMIDATTPVNITSGNSFSLKVRFTPNNSGSKSATLVITHNATGSPTIISLSGNGVNPGFAVNPSSLAFGNVTINTSKDSTLTILNNGTSTLTITNIKATGTDASLFVTVDATMPINISAGNTYTLKIKFTPTSAGLKSANLELTHNASASPSNVAISGTGVSLSPGISLSSTQITFGNVNLNKSKDTNLTISNTGNGILTVSSFTLAGTDASMYMVVNATTPININPGSNYILTVRFSPTSQGLKSANLIIAHNAVGSPTTVNLNGTGSLPNIVESLPSNTYVLNQNYPNPFNPSTRIEYSLPENSNVILTIYNSLGIEIRVLVNQRQSAGRYSVEWSPDSETGGLPSGVYYYKLVVSGANPLQTDKIVQVKKMMYVR